MQGGQKAAIAFGAMAAAGLATVLIVRKAGAAEPEPPEPGLANIYGKVTDASNGKALQGVSVYVGSQYYMLTDSSGKYLFSNIVPGEYTLEFSKQGYASLIL